MTPPRALQWWLNLTLVDTDELIPIARAAEESGFFGLSLGDHLVFPETITSVYPYSRDGLVKWTPSTCWPDPWVAIAAMAAATRALRFVTGVHIAPLRHPVPLAKSLSTASRLSGGRVIGGFGAGWMREEFDLMGEPFEGRGARMDEMLEVMGKLWSGEMVEHHGPCFDLPRVRMSPTPHGRPPIYIGGHNRAALRRAARHDGWIGAHRTIEGSGALIAEVRDLARRSPGSETFTVMMNMLRLAPDEAARLAELGADAVVVPVLSLDIGADAARRLDAIRRAGEALRLV